MSVSFTNIFHYNHDLNGQHAIRQADLFDVAATKSKFVDKLHCRGIPLYGIYGTLSLHPLKTGYILLF